MTSKDKNAKPGTDRPGASPSAGKRPHATLDLKATEVEIKRAEDKSKSDKDQSADKTAAGGSGKPGTGQTPSKGASGSPLRGSAAPSAGSAAGGSDKKTPPAGPPPPAGRRPAGSSGIGRFFSLVAAAILGGVVTLLGADFAADELGFNLRAPTGTDPAQVKAVARRLAALEKAVASNDTGSGQAQLAEQLTAAIARIEKLEAAAATIDKLAKAQKGLLAKSDALAAKLSAGEGKGDGQGVAGRIAKLEETLAAMRAAASAEPGRSGRLPQLASITGKLNDLEAALRTRLQALRGELSEQVSQQLAAVKELASQAVAGSQRLDRDMQTLRREGHKVDQRLVAIKAGADRLAGAVAAVREEAGALRAGLDALKLDTDGRFKSVAKVSDVKSAIQPVSARLNQFQSGLKQVVSRDQDRQANAARIILALELSNLRRTLDRGHGFEAELAEVRKAGGGKLELTALAKYQKDGVPTLTVLQRAFPRIAGAALDAAEGSKSGSVLDRLVAGARSIVRVRRIDHEPNDTSSEAVIARMESHLKAGHLGGVVDEAKHLPDTSRDAIKTWLGQIVARQSVDREIAKIESMLKGSLGAGAQQPAKKGVR